MIIAKIIVFIVNFVLWASGIILIVFGGIALGSPSTIVSLLDLINGVSLITNIIDVGVLLEGMAIFMIVDGSLLFLFGGIGCHGAHRMRKRLLMHYWLLLLLGILVEIGVIIYGGVYPGTAQQGIQSDMYTSLMGNFAPVTISSNGSVTYSNNVTTNAWELLQTQTQCCGAYGPQDYNNSFSRPIVINGNKVILPPTCCSLTGVYPGQALENYAQINNPIGCMYYNLSSAYYNQGCYNVAMNMLWNFEYIAMIIAGCLIAVQLLGSIFTIHTWHRMERDI